MTAPSSVVGVDPGGRETGVILRSGRILLRGVVVIRDDDDWAPYLLDVCGLLDELVAGRLTTTAIRVEEVTPPTGFRRGRAEPINVEGLIGAALVVGAILGRYPEAVLVHAAGHGSGPLAAYPAELVGPREKRGTGRLRHARSAWDVSFATPPAMFRAVTPPVAGRGESR